MSVSINLVCFNSKKTIEKTIESIIKQSFKEWELIIIDNNSNDGTKNIIQKYEKVEPRIRAIYLDFNNQPYSRNLAIKHSKFDYIAVIDADDVATRDRIKLQYNFFLKNKKIDMLGSDVYVVNHNDKIINKYLYPKNENLIKYGLFFGMTMAHPSLMFKKKSKIIYDENFKNSHDRQMLSSNILKLSYANINAKLLYYRKSIDYDNKRETQSKNEIKSILILFKYFNLNIKNSENLIKNIQEIKKKKKIKIYELNYLINYINRTYSYFKKKIKLNYIDKFFIKKYMNKKVADAIIKTDISYYLKLKFYFTNCKMINFYDLIRILLK